MNEDISLLNHKVDTVNAVVIDMKATLKELTTAVTKLTIIEERQVHTTASLERAFKVIENIDNRVSNLEQYVPANKKISVWLDRASWGAIGILVMYVFKKSGLV